MARRSRGFTLLEVLVALSILAIALSAALRAGGQGAAQAGELRLRLLAGWVAENRLASLRTEARLPALGERQGLSTLDRQDFLWREVVSSTGNRHFRRVEIRVMDAGRPESQALGSIVTYLGQP